MAVSDEGFDELCPARTGEPGQARYLAGVQRERHAVAASGSISKPFDLDERHPIRRHGSSGDRRLRNGITALEDHALDKPVGVDLGSRGGVDEASIAQHGVAVADLEHLAHSVGDEDDRNAFVTELAHHLEERLDFGRLEG